MWTHPSKTPPAGSRCGGNSPLRRECVAAHRWTSAYKHQLAAESTHRLAGVLAGLQKPPRVFLVASAIGIYGDRGDEVLDETSAPGAGFLADLCQQWEAAAAPAIQAGIRVVHLRFGVVLGPGQGALQQMLPPFRLGLGARLGRGRQWMSWIGLADVVAAIQFALECPGLTGPLNVTAPNPITNAGFTSALTAIAQTRVPDRAQIRPAHHVRTNGRRSLLARHTRPSRKVRKQDSILSADD